MKYLIVIEKTKNGFGAYSPDVDGCIATGKTRRGTIKLMREALEFHFEGMAMDGDRAPKAGSTSAYVEVAWPKVSPDPKRRGFAVPASVRAARTASRYSARKPAEGTAVRSRP